MKLSGLLGKLRKCNKKEYLQFQFCITLSIFLITSYLFMYGSDLVQKTLPSGGDSRKIADMIFAVAIAGCVMFSIYATSLFLRYKSREIGVFLALGAPKKKLEQALFGEIGKMMTVSSVIGILLGGILAGIIGKVFERIASRGNDNHFTYSVFGAAGGIVYSLILLACVAVLCVRFMKRTNIIDIINEQRKQEPLKKTVTHRYLVLGIVFIAVGVIMGMLVPSVVANVFKHWMGPWTNLFYILAAVGLYRILVYSIAVHKKGKNPQKYYNKMISYGMLKFQGASVVRNMLVVTLLVMGGLLGIFYETMQKSDGYSDFEDDISLRYPLDADELTEEEIHTLADDCGVKIENYHETEFIRILGDGVARADLDEDGNLIEIYSDKYNYYEFISASLFTDITGQQAEISPGHYRMIAHDKMRENIFHKFGDISKLYYDNSEEYIPVTYDGNIVYKSLVRSTGYDNESRYVISDQDYESLKQGLGADKIVRQILFNIEESEKTYAFTEKLYEEFCSRASASMDHIDAYDPYQAELAGEDYGYNLPAIYDGKRPALETDWMYSPVIIPLLEENQLMLRAVFYLLFIYIAVICLAAESIILYTRSQNVALKSKQIFNDLEKLGADRKYQNKLLSFQIRKAFILPTALGSTLIFLYQILIMWQNDGVVETSELIKLIYMAAAVLAIGCYQYILYKLSMKKASTILNIN